MFPSVFDLFARPVPIWFESIKASSQKLRKQQPDSNQPATHQQPTSNLPATNQQPTSNQPATYPQPDSNLPAPQRSGLYSLGRDGGPRWRADLHRLGRGGDLRRRPGLHRPQRPSLGVMNIVVSQRLLSAPQQGHQLSFRLDVGGGSFEDVLQLREQVAALPLSAVPARVCDRYWDGGGHCVVQPR